MNYKLVKELKDAGFPQMPRSDTRDVYFRDIRIPFVNVKYAQYENGQVVNYLDEITIIPTLEELIGACLQKEYGEFQIHKVESLNFWRAGYNYSSMTGFEEYVGDGRDICSAVAKLWLALNKK